MASWALAIALAGIGVVWGQSAESPGTAETLDQANRLVRAAWAEHQVQPVDGAADAEWCRRVYLDLIGRIPTVEELDEFARGRSRAARAELVRRLLYDRTYQDELVRHWATVWSNLWIGRDAAAGNNDRIDSAAFRTYLEEALRENRPYDQLVHELLVAEGTNRPGGPQFSGAVNFLAGKLDDKATQATADVARLFLGVQVQCTQCHDHPFNEWKQDQFWGLNAFFRQTVALRKPSLEQDDAQRVLELTDQDFAGENTRRTTPEQAEVYFELRNGDLRSAYPVFLDGTRIDPSGYVDTVHRRRELARLVGTSDLLARALVNRIWAYFLGHGFTRPLDDMGPHNEPSHPELLDYLAQQVRQHDYDLRQLMEWIVLSEPYGLSSRAARASGGDNPAEGDVPQFSRFYIRQMQPEQLYDSLRLFGPQDGSNSQDAQRRAWLSQFTINFETDDGGETTTFDGTIPQTLMMFNGDLVREATRCEPQTLLGRVWARADWATAEKIHYLYRAALGRSASRRELNVYARLLWASGGNEQEAAEDLWWAVLNSNEFILIH
jgi:hypothetical protein